MILVDNVQEVAPRQFQLDVEIVKNDFLFL